MIAHTYISKTGKRKSVSWSEPMGWALILFFAVAYVFSAYESESPWSQSADALIMLGANYAPLTWYGQEWRLFTHIFIHSNVFHLLVNSLALWAIWKRSAMVFHTGTQLYIFLISGVVSGWVGATHQFDSVSVGSSGAILGLVGAVVGWSLTRSYIRKEVKKSVAGFPSIVLILVLMAGWLLPGMDEYANAGGAVAGLFLGVFISSKSEEEHGIVTAIVLLGVTIVLLCAAMVFSRPSEDKMLRIQREQVSEKAIEYIHETDRKVEEAMKRLWDAPVVKEDSASGSKDSVKKAQDQTELDWKIRWHAQVVVPLERNMSMAASLTAKQEDAYYAQLRLVQQYTVLRLQEARLLEQGHSKIQTIGTSGTSIRAQIVELNKKMEALAVPEKATSDKK